MLKKVRVNLGRKGDMVFGGRPFARLQIQHCDPGGDGREEMTPYETEPGPLFKKLEELEKGGRTDAQDIATARGLIMAHFGTK